MELELWAETSAATFAVAMDWARHPRDRHSTASVARVYHWACLHDRPISWACKLCRSTCVYGTSRTQRRACGP